MTRTKKTFAVLGAMAVWFAAGAEQPAHADPPARAPQVAPIVEGSYATRWGSADLRVLNAGANATLTFGSSAIFWGSLVDGGRKWRGIWIHPDAGASGARRCPRTYGEPGDALHRWPDQVRVRPRTDVWGRFEGQFAADGRGLRLSWSSCDDAVTFNPAGENLFWANKAPPPVITAAAPPTAAPPSLPRDGPCSAVSATAVASIDPCQLEPLRPLRVQLLQDLPKGATRITFTALVDDVAKVMEALEHNRPLPIHPSARSAYQVIRSNKLWLRGDSMDVVPPGAICSHDLWAVSLTDASGAQHGSLGIVNPTCGPGNVVRRVPELRPVEKGAPSAK